MDGKIALEEHFAIPDTMDSSSKLAGTSPQWNQIHRQLLDIQDERLGHMDAHGIEMTILSLNAPAVQSILDRREAGGMARKANDFLAEQVARRPDRFQGFAALPMQDPELAAEELTRCVGELGFQGALVNGFTQRDVEDSVVYFDIDEYRPFWKAVEELGKPFYLHPRTMIPPHMFPYDAHPWLVSATWGFARETSIHALRLIGSGLFDEYPNLQIILGHLGERIPYDLWRIDARIRKLPNGYACKRPMGDYMRENFHVTTSGNFSDPTLRCAIEVLGLDRVMFSVDYPFEDHEDAVGWFDGTSELTAPEKQIVGRDNAVKLFELDLS